MLARRIAKQILGTFVSVLAGWLAALLFLELMTAIELLRQPHYIVPEALYVGPMILGFYMAFFIIPVWLVVLIPLYLFVPCSSALWRWPVCMSCGVAAALLIMGIFFQGIPGVGGLSGESWSFFVMAAIVGGLACLVGALTKGRFKTKHLTNR
jgi:hypothetical protein